MKRTILMLTAIMVLLCLGTSSYGYSGNQNDSTPPIYTPTVDSLLNLIKNTSGPELLKLYPRLHKALYEVNDLDTHLKYSREFAEAARAAKDKKAEAIASALRIEALYNYRASDSILLAEVLLALDVMRGVPSAEVHYFYVANVLVDVYMLAGNYEEALKVAEGFYNEAKQMKNTSGLVASLQAMGKAYGELRLPDKAEASLRESIAIADEITDSAMKGESYSHLVDMLNDQGRYDEALEVSKEFDAYLKRIDAYNGELKNLCFLNCLGYISSYTKLGEYDLAWKYIYQAEDFPVANTVLGIYSVESERLQLLMAQGKYIEAEQSLNRMDEILEDDASAYQANLRMREIRAELYHHRGLYREASDTYREYITQKDSLQKVEITEKLHSLRTRYEVDRLEMQREQDKRSFRNTIIWFIVVLVLFFGIIVIAALNSRRLRAKNRSLLECICEQDKLEQENEQLRSELANRSVSIPEVDEENCKTSDLYFRLRELMKDPDVFTNPDINRKTIAEKLSTNEKYVFDTIRKYYDMSVSDYITHLRLNYARNLLAHPSEKRTVETVAFDAGFSSRSTFHRLFKERYGMTPDEFRRLVGDS